MKVLILSSSTGGGHDMRARSLCAWASQSYPDWQVEIFQTLEGTHGLYRFGVQLYNAIQRIAPCLHHLYFQYLEHAEMHTHKAKILGRERYLAVLDRVRPDVIISTHAHLNHAFFDLAKDYLGHKQVRCVTYCGELHGGYGFSRFWVNPKADLFIGAVGETCAEAAALGMPEHKNFCGGFMLNPSFYKLPLNEAQKAQILSERFGLDPSAFTLVLGTGANGANNHIHLLEVLKKADLALQVIALCGRNKGAQQTIQKWSEAPSKLQVRALGYQEDMYSIMQAASAIVARPGTGTTSEAILSGCPIIFNGLGGVMPQEWITLKFARRHGFGHIMHRARDLPAAVLSYMNEAQRQRHQSRMLACRPSIKPDQLMKRMIAN